MADPRVPTPTETRTPPSLIDTANEALKVVSRGIVDAAGCDAEPQAWVLVGLQYGLDMAAAIPEYAMRLREIVNAGDGIKTEIDSDRKSWESLPVHFPLNTAVPS